MSANVVVDRSGSGTVTPCPYGSGMDVNGGFGGGEGGQVGSSVFWSGVSRVLRGLDWASMSLGVREGWLSVLSNVEGAVAACRAAAVACGAGKVGAAERTAELVRATGMSGRDAAGVVRAADVLVAAPAVAEALATGEITTGHVDAIVRDLPVSHRAAAVADPAVLDAAVSHGVDGFKAGMRSWQAHHDGDLDGARLAARQHARRRLGWSTTGDGMVRLSGELPPEVGAAVTGAIRAESERLWRHEDERAPDPADPAAGRTVAQRNVDALERICQGADNGGTARPRRVDLQVVVGYDELTGLLAASVAGTCDDPSGAAAGDAEPASTGGVAAAAIGGAGRPAVPRRCETSDGVPLAAATVRRLACDAGVIPTVMGGDSQVLDQGRRTRTVSRAQRRALIVRDGGCVFPGCDRPASWCDAHHIIHWLDHGRTDLDNLVLLCSAHHHCVHEGGWRLAHIGGKLVFTDPAGHTLAAEPPTARFRNGHGNGNNTRSRNGHSRVEQAGREDHVQPADPPANGNGHVHEQGQLVPARKQVIQRR